MPLRNKGLYSCSVELLCGLYKLCFATAITVCSLNICPWMAFFCRLKWWTVYWAVCWMGLHIHHSFLIATVLKVACDVTCSNAIEGIHLFSFGAELIAFSYWVCASELTVVHFLNHNHLVVKGDHYMAHHEGSRSFVMIHTFHQASSCDSVNRCTSVTILNWFLISC